MKTLDLNKLTYDELVDTISECQQELENRGTLTVCKIVPYPKFQHSEVLTQNVINLRENKLKRKNLI
jgi:hypothetical protein